MPANPILMAISLAVAGSASATPDTAGQATAQPRPLQGIQCLNPTQARSWTLLDKRHVAVDAGRYQYRMEIAPACTALGYSPTIAFRGDPVGGRVCGSVHDAIVTRDYPCRIVGVELLSKDQYRQAVKEAAEAGKSRRIERPVERPSKSP